MKTKKALLVGMLLTAFTLTTTAGISAMAETVSVDKKPTAVNVVRGLTSSSFKVTDYEGNELGVTKGNFVSADFDYTLYNLNDGYRTSWSGIVPTADGSTKTLGWFYVDLGASMVMDRIILDMQHDWSGQDVVLQVASKADFSDAITIYNNDIDNSLGLGDTVTADPNVKVEALLSNSGAADDGSTGKGGNIFNFSPIVGRYVRVTNNQYGDGALQNYTAVGEIEVYAYELPSVNVVRSLSADAFSVTDYSGNAIAHVVPGRNVSDDFDYTYKNLNDGYKTSWSAIVPSVDGTEKALGWFNVDLGAEYTVSKLMISMQHDWSGQDVVIQLANKADFTDAVTIYNNDIDNSLGLSVATVGNVARNASLKNYGSAGANTENNGNYFYIAPTVARYVRVTNNQYGDDKVHNYTAVGEIEVYATDADITVKNSSEVSPVGFSEVSGTYGKELSIALATSHSDAEIYYTLDGSVPTTQSTKYTAPIEIAMNKNVVIRASACVDGVLGFPVTANYTTQEYVLTEKNVALNKPVKVVSYDMSEDWSDQVYSVNKMNKDGTLKEEGVDDVKYINDGSFSYYYVISTYHKYANGGTGGGNGVGWAIIDFGAAYQIDYVRYDAYWDWQTYNHVIQLANKEDFSDAVTVYENSERIITGKADGKQTNGMIIDVTDTAKYRYIRVSNASTNHSSNPMSVFTEIQAYAVTPEIKEIKEQSYLASYEYNSKPIKVANGTAWEDVAVPTEITATMSDGTTTTVAGTCAMPEGYDGKAGTFDVIFTVTDAGALNDVYGILKPIQFTIVVEKLTPTISVEVVERYVADGDAPEVTVTASMDYTVKYYAGNEELTEAPTAAGEYKVVAMIAEGDNNVAATAEATFVIVDYRALAEKLNEAAALEQATYTTASWTAFAEAKTAAQAVADNAEATQAALDEALNNLTTAANALVVKADFSALQAAVNAAEEVVLDNYVSTGKDAFAAALTAAKAALENDATAQADVDAAKAALEAAQAALAVKGDKTALEAAIAATADLAEATYTAETWTAFASAKAAAEAAVANDDATQTDVDAAKAALEAAQAALVEKTADSTSDASDNNPSDTTSSSIGMGCGSVVGVATSAIALLGVAFVALNKKKED